MNLSLVLRSGLVVLSAGLLFASFGSCSANPGEDSPYGGTGGGAGAGGVGAGGTGIAGTGAGVLPFDGSDNDGALTEAGACAADTIPGKLVPLDIYVLLDATASMKGAGDTPVVWPDVTSALVSIIKDPMSYGIGVGLTYLPVPPAPGTVIPGKCTVQADCGLYGPCLNLGTTKVCNGSFAKSVSCDPGDYGKPVVDIGVLDQQGAHRDKLVQEIQGKDPDGDATPTEPSLRGALTYAKQWASDHSNHLTYVLFATDGLPNNCTTNSIKGAAQAAKEAFDGNPSVPTYVLGIGDLGDLNQIASGGGTGTAYIASASDVADKMVTMFNEIRANGACKFQIPAPQTGTPNYQKVNVSYVPLGETEGVTIVHKKSAAECDPVKGGWYYDDETEQHPTKIILCPASCKEVQLSEQGVSVLLGCDTVLF